MSLGVCDPGGPAAGNAPLLLFGDGFEDSSLLSVRFGAPSPLCPDALAVPPGVRARARAGSFPVHAVCIT